MCNVCVTEQTIRKNIKCVEWPSAEFAQFERFRFASMHRTTVPFEYTGTPFQNYYLCVYMYEYINTLHVLNLYTGNTFGISFFLFFTKKK